MGGDIWVGWLYLTPDMMNSVIWPCAHVCQRASTKASQAVKAINPAAIGRSSRARIEPPADRCDASVPVVDVSCTVFIRPMGKPAALREEDASRTARAAYQLPSVASALNSPAVPCG